MSDEVPAVGEPSDSGTSADGGTSAPQAGAAATPPQPAAATTQPQAGAASPPNSRAISEAGVVGLALGAIGVVFGDIGTSPLYSLQTAFSIDHNEVKPTSTDVYGVISLVFWTITLIVSIKYVAFIMRADNDGEGGIMALAALIREKLRTNTRRVAVAMVLGVVGAGLFYGDSLITPAISVLSAVEGIEVAAPGAHDVVLPVGIAILTLLFLVQRWGTHYIGRIFGPVMVLWFVVLAVTGLPHIISRPGILRALSPTYAFAFVFDDPFVAFIAMGAVVLAITGAEALYADMGHFGRRPIRLAWFAVAFPALGLNYLGQGALILDKPTSISNPFYLLSPGWARIPMVVLATVATVIASQSVISGAFSVSRQAVRLGFLPQLTIRHTSRREIGQIYVPAVNWLLFVGVLLLMIVFRSSSRLATAYGLAVTGTFLLTTTLFLILAGSSWRWRPWKIVAFAVVFGGLELTFFAANLTKVVHGGWLPLAVAALVITVMLTWQRGRSIMTQRRTALEGSLPEFVEKLRAHALPRVQGTAVFPHPTNTTTPLALRANVEFNHVLHEHVVIVSVLTQNVPHIPVDQRLSVDDLGYGDDGISHLEIRLGFQDERDIPAMLRQASHSCHELDFDPDEAFYFVSRMSIERGTQPVMATWRKRLFITLSHNAASPAAYFRLPDSRTVVMGSRVEL